MKSQTLHETECGASRSNGYALLDRKLSAPLDMLLTTEHNWCQIQQVNYLKVGYCGPVPSESLSSRE